MGKQILTTTSPAFLKNQDVGSVPRLRKWGTVASTRTLGTGLGNLLPQIAQVHRDFVRPQAKSRERFSTDRGQKVRDPGVSGNPLSAVGVGGPEVQEAPPWKVQV